MFKQVFCVKALSILFRWGKTDMKSAGSVLLEHWQAIHGDPVKMLYYAQEANKVLTAKVKNDCEGQ